MKLFSTAIGESYEKESARLEYTLNYPVEVFTSSNSKYKELSTDSLINGLAHKSNFANYIDQADSFIIFMDADMFTLSDNPFETFSVDDSIDVAYVNYGGKWHMPDKIRQDAFDFFGHKINSGFLYFKNLEVAKKVCDQWHYEYLERVKIYDSTKGASKHEYDEWALMIALSKLNLVTGTLDKKWNDFDKSTKSEMIESGSIFFQSHDLDITKEE